jgi:signal transduction histidine kinase
MKARRQLLWVVTLAAAAAVAVLALLHGALEQRGLRQVAQLRQTYNTELIRHLAQFEQALASTPACADEACARVALEKLQREFPWVQSIDAGQMSQGLPASATPTSAAGLIQSLAGREAAMLSGRAVYAAAPSSSRRHTVRCWVRGAGDSVSGRSATFSAEQLVATINGDLAVMGQSVTATIAADRVQAPPDATNPLESAGITLELAVPASDWTRPDAMLSAVIAALAVMLVASAGWIAIEALRRQTIEQRLRDQESRVQASAKLTTLGEIASTLSHELNQPLAAIENYASAALNAVNSQEPRMQPLAGSLTQIRTQVQRCDRIIRSVHSFLRSRPDERSEFDVGQAMGELRPLIELQATRRGVALDMRCDTAARLVGQRTLVEQAILNLAVNGIEAMDEIEPSRRRLTVEVIRLDVPAATDAPGGYAVEIRVTDRGTGVAPQVSENLFRPFVTTKPNGLGLGLAICRTTAESHRGTLQLSPLAGGGTIASLVLPSGLPYAASADTRGVSAIA